MAKGRSTKRKDSSKAQTPVAVQAEEGSVLVRNSLSEAQGKADLVARLKAVHEELREVSQDERPEGLDEISRALAESRILNHKDKDVRLLAVCCVVDVLRIYAPEAPYSQDELKSIFEAIVSQLHGIGTITDSESPSAEKYLYILENLATVKSCIILVELNQQGIAGAEELLTELFQALFGSVRPAHATQVLEHMHAVLVGCLDECETYPQSVLDVICTALLPAHKIENSAAYKLTQLVLSRAGEQVQHSITHFVNQVLGGSSAMNSGSDLSEHIYPLIYELHKAVPVMVTFIIPSVSVQLQSEDEEARYKAVALLGRLFASQNADYGDQLAKHFRDFLGRFEDVHPSVRKEMLNVASSIITKKPNIRGLVEERVVERLRDPDHEIRSKATSVVIDIAMGDISVLASSTIDQLIERVKDKKQAIRNEAITGLCKLYGKHVVSVLPELEDEFPAETLENDAYHKLEAVPRYLLRCWTYTDAPTRALTLQLLQETLIPKALPDGQRALAVLLIYSACTDQDRLILQNIFALKKKGSAALHAFLERKMSPTRQTAEADVQVEMKELLEMLPVAERKLSVLQKLHACKDKKVFRSLQMLANGIDSCDAKFKANDDVCRRLGSQTAVGELMNSLISRWCPMFISGEVISRLVEYCRRAGSDDEMHQTAMQLLDQLAQHFSAMFAPSESAIVTWLQAAKARPKQLEVILKCVISTAKHFTEVDELATCLQDVANNNKKVEVCNLAVKALVMLAEQGMVSGAFQNFIRGATSNKMLSVTNPRLEHLLNGLQVVLTAHLPDVRERSVHQWTEFARDIVLNVEGIIVGAPSSKKAQGKLSVETQTAGNILAALELWIVGLSHSSEGAYVEDEFNQALDTVFTVISSDGATVRGVDVPEAYQTAARRVATTCALELMRSVECRSLLSIERWHELGWTMHDGADEVRLAFLDKLTSMFEEGALNLRFMAYFALAATDDNDGFLRTAKRCLLETIFRFRATYARESAKLATRGAEAQAIIEKIATTSMPEYVVPYLLHLLSHHPDFPVDAADTGRLDRMKRCIEFMLTALFTSVVGEADNLSFLIQMVNTIHANYIDTMAQDVDRLHWLSRIMIKSLKQRIKTQDNLQQYPGQIYLPHNLYKVMTSDEKKRRRTQAASAPFDDSDVAAPRRRVVREPKRQRQAAMDNFLSTPSKRSPTAVTGGSAERSSVRTPLKTLDLDDNAGKRSRAQKKQAPKGKAKNKRMSKRSARDDDDEEDGDDDNDLDEDVQRPMRSPTASKRPRRSGADYDGAKLRSKQSDEYIPGEQNL